MLEQNNEYIKNGIDNFCNMEDDQRHHFCFLAGEDEYINQIIALDPGHKFLLFNILMNFHGLRFTNRANIFKVLFQHYDVDFLDQILFRWKSYDLGLEKEFLMNFFKFLISNWQHKKINFLTDSLCYLASKNETIHQYVEEIFQQLFVLPRLIVSGPAATSYTTAMFNYGHDQTFQEVLLHYYQYSPYNKRKIFGFIINKHNILGKKLAKIDPELNRFIILK